MQQTAKISWLDIHTQFKYQYARKIQHTGLVLMDYLLQFPLFRDPLVYDIMRIKGDQRQTVLIPSSQMEVLFETDFNKVKVTRTAYSLFNFVSDLGGLTEGLFIVLTFVVMFLQRNAADWKIIGYLFQSEN